MKPPAPAADCGAETRLMPLYPTLASSPADDELRGGELAGGCEPRGARGPISRITFGWATYLLARGNRQVLEFEDLPPVREDVLTERVWRSWKREWERELQLRPERPSLYRSLWRVYRGTLAVTGMMQFSYWAVAVGNPLIMREILKFVVDPRAERWHGYALAAALFVAPLIGAFVNAHSLLLNFRSGMEMRSALSAEVYRKALVLDNGARQGATVGQITNLMATDCQRFAEVSLIIQMLWIAPLVIFVVLGLLIWVIGWHPECRGALHCRGRRFYSLGLLGSPVLRLVVETILRFPLEEGHALHGVVSHAIVAAYSLRKARAIAAALRGTRRRSSPTAIEPASRSPPARRTLSLEP
eukprot:tig00020941_g16224.t1